MKVTCTFESTHISYPLLNKEPSLEGTETQITLIFSTNVSVTSRTSHFIELGSSHHMHVEEHPVTKDLDPMTSSYESSISLG